MLRDTETEPAPAIVIGTTDPAIRSVAGTVATSLDRPGNRVTSVGVATATLAAAFELLPGELRAGATLVVLADAWSRWAARRFALRRADSRRTLRPSDSVGLETAELVRPFAVESGWRGACYLVSARAEDAVTLAAAMRCKAVAVVLAEILPLATDELGDPGCVLTVAIWPATAACRPPPSAFSVPGALLPALAARYPRHLPNLGAAS